jgi:hypothetical protein
MVYKMKLSKDIEKENPRFLKYIKLWDLTAHMFELHVARILQNNQLFVKKYFFFKTLFYLHQPQSQLSTANCLFYMHLLRHLYITMNKLTGLS